MAEQNIWMQFIVDFGENTEKRDEFVHNFTDVFKDVYITLKDSNYENKNTSVLLEMEYEEEVEIVAEENQWGIDGLISDEEAEAYIRECLNKAGYNDAGLEVYDSSIDSEEKIFDRLREQEYGER